MNDRFKRIIDNGYKGYTTNDAQTILRNSAEVSLYVEEKRDHLKYVSQLMHDDIINAAVERLKKEGKWCVPPKPTQREQERSRQFIKETYFSPKVRLNEEYPTQRVQQYQTLPQSKDDVMSRLDAMEQEMNELRKENQELRNRYNNLK